MNILPKFLQYFINIKIHSSIDYLYYRIRMGERTFYSNRLIEKAYNRFDKIKMFSNALIFKQTFSPFYSIYPFDFQTSTTFLILREFFLKYVNLSVNLSSFYYFLFSDIMHLNLTESNNKNFLVYVKNIKHLNFFEN